MELLALLFKYLIGIFFAPAHTLQLGKILSIWQSFLQLCVLVFVGLELRANVLEGKSPLFLQRVVLLKASAHVPFILLVVLRDLRFALLEDFNLQTTLARPLLS